MKRFLFGYINNGVPDLSLSIEVFCQTSERAKEIMTENFNHIVEAGQNTGWVLIDERNINITEGTIIVTRR